MNSRKHFPWKRFWCPKGGNYRLGDDGYLLDPDNEYLIDFPEVYAYRRFNTKPCMVLLGEPGIGKSQALSDFKARRLVEISSGPDDLLYLDLRSYSSEQRLIRDIFESPNWAKWLDGTFTLELILDSLDECMIHVKTVAGILTDELRKYPVSRLHLRIACRTAEWPKLLDEELPQIWGQENFGLYELLPLRRTDVEMAAKMEGIEVPIFMELVQHRDMVPFAIKPVTLLMLIQDFKDKGTLAGTQTELYHDYLLHLCREQSRSRLSSGALGALLPEQKLAVAERIAALSVFSKRASIYEGHDERDLRSDEDMTIKHLIGGQEWVGNLSFEVTRDSIEEVLSATGLFVSGEGDRLVWSHWTYAEFLAAMYLDRHGVTDEQATDLLFHSHPITESSSLLVPQLQETAAWLAGKRSSLFDTIMRSDPTALLKSPVANADYAQRKALLQSLLGLAEAGEITDMEIGMRQRYELLCHPEIAAQLRPYIINRDLGFLVRRMAIDIAEACRVESLADALMQIASDRDENIQERIEAAHAIAEIGCPELPSLFRQLLDDTDSDDRDELKGIALRKLWPKHMTTEELFTYITPPKRENLHGMYALFVMQELAPQLGSAELPLALEWVRKQPTDHELSFRLQRLAADILQHAWNHLDDDSVLRAFADTAFHRLKNYDSILGSREAMTAEPSTALAETDKSRRLTQALVPMFVDSDDDVLLLTIQPSVVRADDLFWLIEKLQACQSEQEQRIWARLIQGAYEWGRTDHLEAVLAARQNNEILKTVTAPLFDAIELNSPEAEQLRRQHARMLRFEQRKTKTAKHPPMPRLVNDWLDKFEAGDLNAWWRLTLDMRLEEDSDQYPYGAELRSDVTSLPGWKNVDDQTRTRIVKAAGVYLFDGDPHTDEWLGKKVFHFPAAAGYKALMLLQRIMPELVEQLAPELWSKWTPIVLAYPEFPSADSRDCMEKIVALANSNAPESFAKTLLILIEKENQEHGHIFITAKLDQAWDDQLVDTIKQKIQTDSSLTPVAFSDLLKKPIELGFEVAREFAASLVKANLEPKSPERDKAKYCGALLLIHAGERGWQLLKPIFEQDPSFGKEVVAEVARQDGYRGRGLAKLSEISVAELFVWITKEFPHSEDPEHDRAHWVGERESIANFRDSLLRGLREKGTANAVEAIKYIGELLPQSPWIKYVGLDARQLALRKSWEGHSPEVILELFQHKERRLVDNGQQLIEAVVASLNHFQAKLHEETPAVYDLWNENDWTPKEENSISNRIKRHLQEDLKDRHIIVNREVEIRKGQETDIHVDAISNNGEIISMIIEVKGCWHKELKTAMQSQLRDRYLRENRCEQGLYLVAWFLCPKWNEDDYRKRATVSWSLAQAVEFFERQANKLSQPGEALYSYILDAALR